MKEFCKMFLRHTKYKFASFCQNHYNVGKFGNIQGSFSLQRQISSQLMKSIFFKVTYVYIFIQTKWLIFIQHNFLKNIDIPSRLTCLESSLSNFDFRWWKGGANWLFLQLTALSWKTQVGIFTKSLLKYRSEIQRKTFGNMNLVCFGNKPKISLICFVSVFLSTLPWFWKFCKNWHFWQNIFYQDFLRVCKIFKIL